MSNASSTVKQLIGEDAAPDTGNQDSKPSEEDVLSDERIADEMRNLDELLAATEKKLTLLIKHKQGLMRKLQREKIDRANAKLRAERGGYPGDPWKRDTA